VTRRVPPSDLTRVRSLATAFRNAIEDCDRASLGVGFAHFPEGSCDDTALLLGAFLIENHEAPFTDVYGEWGAAESFGTHAWIERNGLIVDITADQFDDIDERVIVTTVSAWHDARRAYARGRADYRLCPRAWANLARSYAIILSRVRDAA
jgi:hypothetical protein